MEFFSSKNYNMDVVDIVIQNCTGALALGISIYMNEGGHLKIVKYSGLGKMCKSVFLKFSHDPMHPQASHYDTIVNVKETASYNLTLLSSIPSQQSKAEATVSATGEDVPQDQPLDLSSKGDTLTQVKQERNEVIDLTDIQIVHWNYSITNQNWYWFPSNCRWYTSNSRWYCWITRSLSTNRQREIFSCSSVDNIHPQDVNKKPEHLEGLQFIWMKKYKYRTNL